MIQDGGSIRKSRRHSAAVRSQTSSPDLQSVKNGSSSDLSANQLKQEDSLSRSLSISNSELDAKERRRILRRCVLSMFISVALFYSPYFEGIPRTYSEIASKACCFYV